MIPMQQWLAERQKPSCTLGATHADAGAENGSGETIAEAYARGFAASDAASQELVQRTIAIERAHHAGEMQRAEAAWRETALRETLSSIAAAFEELHASLAHQLAAALAGFLEGGAQSKALIAFRAALDDLAETQALIRIEGSPELLDALCNLGPLPEGVTTKHVNGNELRAVAGDTAIDTALGKWLHAIHGDHG